MHDDTTDYTVEFWHRLDQIDQNNHVLATIASLSSEVGVFSNVRQNGQIYYHIHRGQNGTTFKEINSQIGAISANVWNHVAIVNQVGQDLKLYLNGQSISDQGSSFTTVATPSTSNPRSPLHIGASSGQTGGSTGPMNGQIQDFRISKRVVYTNNFAPPTSLLDDSCATLPEVSSFSGWNYSTTFTSPASNAGGSNNKTFWNDSPYNGRGYYHPSSTNKLKMFDGDGQTYAGDYLIKEYSTAVWEKIAMNSNIDSGTATIKFSLRCTNAYYADRRSPGFFLCWRRSDQAFNGTRLKHYMSNGYNSNTHTYQLRASRVSGLWDAGATNKVYTYNINFTGGIEEILLGVFQAKSGGCCWGMRIYEVSISS